MIRLILWVDRVTLPLEGLTPGEYVLTLEARAGTHVAERKVPLAVD